MQIGPFCKLKVALRDLRQELDESASAAIISPCGRTTQGERSGRLFPVLATSFLHRRPAGTLNLLFRGDAVETAKRHHELVLVVRLALSETPPRHAGHAVRPWQCTVDVPQYSMARFRRYGRAPRVASTTRTPCQPGLGRGAVRGAGHAVRPSQYAIAVPQYSVPCFRRTGRAPHRELVLVLSQAVPTLAQPLLLRRTGLPRAPSTRRRGPVLF